LAQLLAQLVIETPKPVDNPLATMPDLTPLLETVVVQATPFCNINCRYCYLPQRNDRTVMAQSTVAALFEKVFSSGWVKEALTIIWHAGEPLVLPIAYYEAAFASIEALRPRNLQLQHSIQTNGMLITPAWCDLFKTWDINVGVSIDGPQRMHDAQRITRSGRGTFEKTLAGIRMLRQHKVPFHVISVLSEAAMEAPQEMLDFYVSEGIEDICFNVEESEGSHVSELFAAGDAQGRFKRFLQAFWQISRQGKQIRFIREVDGMLSRVFRPNETSMRNSQVEPFGMMSVDCRGNVSSFSPELLGLKNANYDDFIVGNINTDSLESMRHSHAMTGMARDIALGVEACRRNCEYFSVCGGGAPVNKLAETGSFSATRTSFCSLTQMVPIDLILEAFDRLKDREHENYQWASDAMARRAEPGLLSESGTPSL
jgi:uncharacterized protein